MGLLFWRCLVCRAVKTPIFSTAVTQWSPPFFLMGGSHSMTPIFLICHPKPVFFSIPTANWLFQMILCTIIRFKVRNVILGASVGLHLSLKDWKLHSHLKCPHNFGPKCSLSPNDPIFMQFSSHPMPLGAKTDALHQYRFHFYMSIPPIILYTIKFQAYFSFL